MILQEGRILWTATPEAVPKGASTIWYAKLSSSPGEPMDSKAFHLARLFGHQVRQGWGAA